MNTFDGIQGGILRFIIFLKVNLNQYFINFFRLLPGTPINPKGRLLPTPERQQLCNMAHHPGLIVVAEGIEHRALLQGFLFASPMPLKAVVSLPLDLEISL